MRRAVLLGLAILLMGGSISRAGLLEELSQGFELPGPSKNLDDKTMAKGLKEALSVGTDRAIKAVAKTDGYFGNEAIKIILPEKIRNVVDFLGKVGFQDQVDEFVLSMNRAAEKAAPKAASFFVEAVKEMSFEDARGILQGGDTSATEYFKEKTHDKIYAAFKPIIGKSMSEVGVTSKYRDLMGEFEALPLIGKADVDLDHYVTNRALDGLFHMLGEEEKKIRQNPVARTSDLLRKVFGK